MPQKVKFCCDPLKMHKKKITKNLRPILNEDLIDSSCGLLNLNSLLCVNCIKRIQKEPEIMKEMSTNLGTSNKDLSTDSDTSSSTMSNINLKCIPSPSKKDVNKEILSSVVLPSIDESPIKLGGLTPQQKRKRGTSKLLSTTSKMKRGLEAAYGVHLPGSFECETSSCIDKKNEELEKYEQLMTELKDKFNSTKDSKLKLQILSLSPFTIDKTSKFFKTTTYLVKKSRDLKRKYGVLPEVPLMSKGRVISNDMKMKVANFYELDENSRQCPGMKDYKSVINEDGERVKIQKRLILCNLRELYVDFCKDSNNPNIGFSTFASLRPAWCILAGSKGTHSVCVCTYHQNPKLQLAALGLKEVEYSQLMAASVCDINNQDCMMHVCKKCPREQGVRDFLEEFDQISLPEEVHYKQWVTVDRCSLTEKVENSSDFLESLSKSITNLTKHHFTSKHQSQYFKKLKNNLHSQEGCVVGDFAENYSFIVQDAVQGFHWENAQCTVHPFVFYWKHNDNVCHQSYCFISDSLKHNTVMVYSFLNELIPAIQKEHPTLQKIHYFTDGCAAQYKNKFNFLNLCHHKADFGVNAEWNFFATSHGKNACDGIGGTVKRAAARASLQRHIDNQILTARNMYHFCSKEFKSSINFLYVSSTQVKEIGDRLNQRFVHPFKPVVGTLKFHRFVPMSKDSLMVYTLSENTKGDLRTLKAILTPTDHDKSDSIQGNTFTKINVGCFVACVYEQQLWFGLVKDYDAQYEDYIINFLQPSGVAPSYTFPNKEDSCPVEAENILGTVQAGLRGGTRIQYVFQKDDIERFAEKLRTLLT